MAVPKFLLERYPPYSQRSRPKIFPGDTFPVVYEARQVDQQNFGNVDGLPEAVVSATAKVRSLNDDAWLELGGVGVTEVEIDVVPPNGDIGAMLSYTIPSAFTVEGDYYIYITAVFGDEEVFTINRKFTVMEFGR